MPEMSGEDLYRRIEHGWPHLAPRVVLVMEARPDRPLRAHDGGRPVPVLAKPYPQARLLHLIEEVVARDVYPISPRAGHASAQIARIRDRRRQVYCAP